jgi:hypothetical protein
MFIGLSQTFILLKIEPIRDEQPSHWVLDNLGMLIRAFKSGIITADEADDDFASIKRANRHISAPLINKVLEMIHSEE